MTDVSNFDNRSFLYRINKILLGRKKHPWGKALGLKPARINSIFEGAIPTADALQIIHQAEKVRIDWLLTGVGSPYQVRTGSDQSLAALVLDWGQQGWRAVVVTDSDRLALLMMTEQRVGSGADAIQYDDIEVIASVGLNTLMTAVDLPGVQVVESDRDTLSSILRGNIGPYQIISSGLLQTGRPLTDADASRLRAVVAGTAVDEDAARLVSHFRNLKPSEKTAVLVIMSAMDSKTATPGDIASAAADYASRVKK